MQNTDYEDHPVAECDSLAAIAEVDGNTQESICRIRAHERFTLKTKVVAQPGNVSQRRELKIQGVSGDISAGGCCVLFPLPLNVGDIYQLIFDREVLDVAPTYARCLRCRLVREDAFECGFFFFTPLDLSFQKESAKKSEAGNVADDLFD